MGAPRHIRLFVNSPNLDFDSAENNVPSQSFDLQEQWCSSKQPATGGEVGSVTCDLKLNIPRFQRATGVTLFVVDNVGEEEFTALQLVRLCGTRVHKVTV